MSRTCDELGLCQHRNPRCASCAHPFAPGVVTRHRRPRNRALWRLLKRAAGLVLFAGLVGVWIGVAGGRL